MRARVNRMIRKQMKEMDASKDYLGDKLRLPNLPTLESPWLKAEIDRVVHSQAQKSNTSDHVMEYVVVPDPTEATVEAYTQTL